ncbi:MAG: DNA translocase FtsK, partial [Gemmataceae bacterium]|nr:DNA translocase FtsK [Gemmataceae bacterium]
MKARRESRSATKARAQRSDGIAWLLLVAGLLVALCLLSHDARSDDKLLDHPGTWIAAKLLFVFGIGAYVLLATWFGLVLLLLLRKRWWVCALRVFGWLILLTCTAVAAECLGGDLLGPTISDRGGALGMALNIWLDKHLTGLGKGIACCCAGAAGLLLAANTLASAVVTWSWTISKHCGFVLARLLGPLTVPRSRTQARSVQTVAPPAAEKSIPINHAGVKSAPDDSSTSFSDDDAPMILPIQRHRGDAVEDLHRFDDFVLPPTSLLTDPEPFPFEQHDQKLRETAALLEKTFQDFDLNIRVVGINTGPVITQYEVALETGMRVNKVTALADDLALHLRVPSVRVVAPIPGKNTVGIEVPNEHRAIVRLKEVLQTAGRRVSKMKLPLFLGKDTEGRPLLYDLADMPHLLIAGSTGTGKSVCMNAIILSMLMTRRPNEVKMIMIDPKMTELTEYGKIPHLMHPVVKDM